MKAKRKDESSKDTKYRQSQVLENAQGKKETEEPSAILAIPTDVSRREEDATAGRQPMKLLPLHPTANQSAYDLDTANAPRRMLLYPIRT